MTIPATPLPSFIDVMRAVFGPVSNGRSWASGHGAVFFFERGAGALAAAVEAIRGSHPGRPITVWAPDLICDEPLDWIRAAGFEISYYRTTATLEPDWDFMRGRLSPEAVHALVIVHYFGFPNRALRMAAELASGTNVVVIEDAAHVLAPCAGVGESGLVVYSPRKLFTSPSVGCLVITDHSAHVTGGYDRGDGAGKWIVRRLTQRILRAARLNWHRRWANQPGDPPRSRRTVGCLRCAPAVFTRRMLAIEESRLSSIHATRRRNYLRLADYVGRSGFLVPVFSHLPDGVCPYVLAVRVPAQIERVVREFRSAGTPASRWPDLPVEVVNDAGSFAEAIALADTLMLLPIHQGLSESDIDMIGAQVLRIGAGMTRGAECAS